MIRRVTLRDIGALQLARSGAPRVLDLPTAVVVAIGSGRTKLISPIEPLRSGAHRRVAVADGVVITVHTVSAVRRS